MLIIDHEAARFKVLLTLKLKHHTSRMYEPNESKIS